MKILTSEQLRELDKFTMKHEPISSYDLMERAATEALKAFPKHWEFDERPFYYFCGKGNNGGDGLAMARIHSQDDKRDITVVILEHTQHGSADFGQNLYLLKDEDKVDILHIDMVEQLPEIPDNAIIVDAILGSGLTRPLDGFLAQVVNELNKLGNQKVSIDMPTGLFAEDNSTNNLHNVFKADMTVTFHCPKLSFLLPDTGEFAGTLKVVDIGLLAPEAKQESAFSFLDNDEVRPLIRKRAKFSHKGTFGHALLLSGSRGKMGAAQLAASATMRSGAGRLTVHVPTCGLDIIQLSLREAMCTVDPHGHFITELPDLEPYDAIAIGPGIGTDAQTANVLRELLSQCKVPLVIDADGLNILANNPDWLHLLPPNTILTPHPKEFERLVGKWGSSMERLQLQRELSEKYGVIVVLKGAHTSISVPTGNVHFNATGNPGMASAGVGDVLTGVVLGLLSQGYEPEVAAIIAVHVHGFSADIAKEMTCEESMNATEIIGFLGNAFKETMDPPRPFNGFPFNDLFRPEE
ncbi:MAG: NAD(P)H-hydrate dehydratase [Bacteroidetes bacterium]|nr:MAG: NAD(P)H-hydrate dehydratase [Bacteroidota bacterium]